MLQCLKSCFVNIYPKKSVEKHTADIYKHRFLFRIITWKSQHQRCCVSKPRGFGQNGLNWLHFLVLGPWVELILALYILFIEVQVICVCSLWHPDLVALRCTCFLSMFGRLEPCSYPKSSQAMLSSCLFTQLRQDPRENDWGKALALVDGVWLMSIYKIRKLTRFVMDRFFLSASVVDSFTKRFSICQCQRLLALLFSRKYYRGCCIPTIIDEYPVSYSYMMVRRCPWSWSHHV